MNIKETIGLHTVYIITECDPTLATKEYQALLNFLSWIKPTSEDGLKFWREQYQRLRQAYESKAIVKKHELVNLSPTVGRSVLAQRLAGTLTYTGTINYLAVGSGVTVPANGDTTLATEVYRQVVTDATYANNIAYLSCFIAAGTATGTHTEAGLFIDGAAGANTGQIISRVLLTPQIVKAALNTLSFDVSISVS